MPRVARVVIPLLLFVACRAQAQLVRHALAPGVELTQELVAPPAGPLYINCLRIDLKKPGVHVQTALAQDVVLADDPTQGREPVGSVAARHAAIAAVNADFFPYTGKPLGIAIRDGELVSEGMDHRVAMGFSPDGAVLLDTLLSVGTLYGSDGAVGGLDGINRLPGRDEIVLLTPTFGNRARVTPPGVLLPLTGLELPVKAGREASGVAGQVAVADPRAPLTAGSAVLTGTGLGAEWLRTHVKIGDRLRLRFDFVANPLPPGPPRGTLASRAGSMRGRLSKSEWTDVTQAVGGGPWLVRDGKPALDAIEEAFEMHDFVGQRHPRTAAGVNAAGELMLVTVDGRQPHSRGMTLAEMADLMVRLGAVRAINLDGGGSSQMVARGIYLNAPSDGEPRAVADVLLIYADGAAQSAVAPPAGGPSAPVAQQLVTLHAGESIALLLPPTEGQQPAPEVLWGTLEGRALVTPQGVLRGTHAGSGTVVAQVGGVEIRFPYTILPGPPTALKGELAQAPNNPPDRRILNLRVVDAYGNGVPDQVVEVKVGGGTPEKPQVRTDARGRASIEVVWDAEKDRRVTLTSGPLGPLMLTAK